jgi:hypothetical protein
MKQMKSAVFNGAIEKKIPTIRVFNSQNARELSKTEFAIPLLQTFIEFNQALKPSETRRQTLREWRFKDFSN